MKSFLITLAFLILSSNGFAAVKCFQEFRNIEGAVAAHTVDTDKVTAYGIQTGNYIMAVAVELIDQPNTRVGGYGYNVKTNAQTTLDSFNFLQKTSKASEQAVMDNLKALEDCLINK